MTPRTHPYAFQGNNEPQGLTLFFKIVCFLLGTNSTIICAFSWALRV